MRAIFIRSVFYFFHKSDNLIPRLRPEFELADMKKSNSEIMDVLPNVKKPRRRLSAN